MADPARALPRWLPIEAAAAHLSISAMTFRRRVKAGVLPPPALALGMQRWDREALDAAMAGGMLPRSPEDIADAIAARMRSAAQNRPQAPRGRHGAGIPIRPRPISPRAS